MDPVSQRATIDYYNREEARLKRERQQIVAQMEQDVDGRQHYQLQRQLEQIDRALRELETKRRAAFANKWSITDHRTSEIRGRAQTNVIKAGAKALVKGHQKRGRDLRRQP